MVPSATFETGDGRWVIIGGNGDSVYTRLMAAVGRPDMGMQNQHYATNPLRCQREEEIYQVPIKRLLGRGLSRQLKDFVPGKYVLTKCSLLERQLHTHRAPTERSRRLVTLDPSL